MSTNGEVIHVHVGQAGVQIANACWELYCLEHGINADGCMYERPVDTSFTTFFSYSISPKMVPRAILVDSEPTVIDEVRTGAYRCLFKPETLISGKEESGSNFARGYNLLSAEMIESTMNALRCVAEGCNNLKGFIMFRALGGGTGSGFGDRIMESIFDEFGRTAKLDFNVFPSPTISPLIVEPYNSLLASHMIMDLGDCTFIIDNEALYQICETRLDVSTPTFTNLNRIIGQAVSALTASIRFEGSCNVTIADFQTNLVPFPRIHFPLISYAPLLNMNNSYYTEFTTEQLTLESFNSTSQFVNCNPHEGKFMTCMLLYRGNIVPHDINRVIRHIKKQNTVQFVDWAPTGFKVGVNAMPPVMVPGGDIGLADRALIGISNNTAIKEIWNRGLNKYHNLFSKRAFIHHFISEGIEEDTFNEAAEDINTLIDDYEEVEKSYFPAMNVDTAQRSDSFLKKPKYLFGDNELPRRNTGSINDCLYSPSNTNNNCDTNSARRLDEFDLPQLLRPSTEPSNRHRNGSGEPHNRSSGNDDSYIVQEPRESEEEKDSNRNNECRDVKQNDSRECYTDEDCNRNNEGCDVEQNDSRECNTDEDCEVQELYTHNMQDEHPEAQGVQSPREMHSREEFYWKPIIIERRHHIQSDDGDESYWKKRHQGKKDYYWKQVQKRRRHKPEIPNRTISMQSSLNVNSSRSHQTVIEGHHIDAQISHLHHQEMHNGEHHSGSQELPLHHKRQSREHHLDPHNSHSYHTPIEEHHIGVRTSHLHHHETHNGEHHSGSQELPLHHKRQSGDHHLDPHNSHSYHTPIEEHQIGVQTSQLHHHETHKGEHHSGSQELPLHHKRQSEEHNLDPHNSHSHHTPIEEHHKDAQISHLHHYETHNEEHHSGSQELPLHHKKQSGEHHSNPHNHKPIEEHHIGAQISHLHHHETHKGEHHSGSQELPLHHKRQSEEHNLDPHNSHSHHTPIEEHHKDAQISHLHHYETHNEEHHSGSQELPLHHKRQSGEHVSNPHNHKPVEEHHTDAKILRLQHHETHKGGYNSGSQELRFHHIWQSREHHLNPYNHKPIEEHHIGAKTSHLHHQEMHKGEHHLGPQESPFHYETLNLDGLHSQLVPHGNNSDSLEEEILHYDNIGISEPHNYDLEHRHQVVHVQTQPTEVVDWKPNCHHPHGENQDNPPLGISSNSCALCLHACKLAHALYYELQNNEDQPKAISGGYDCHCDANESQLHCNNIALHCHSMEHNLIISSQDRSDNSSERGDGKSDLGLQLPILKLKCKVEVDDDEKEQPTALHEPHLEHDDYERYQSNLDILKNNIKISKQRRSRNRHKTNSTVKPKPRKYRRNFATADKLNRKRFRSRSSEYSYDNTSDLDTGTGVSNGTDLESSRGESNSQRTQRGQSSNSTKMPECSSVRCLDDPTDPTSNRNSPSDSYPNPISPSTSNRLIEQNTVYLEDIENSSSAENKSRFSNDPVTPMPNIRPNTKNTPFVTSETAVLREHIALRRRLNRMTRIPPRPRYRYQTRYYGIGPLQQQYGLDIGPCQFRIRPEPQIRCNGTMFEEIGDAGTNMSKSVSTNECQSSELDPERRTEDNTNGCRTQ